MNNPGDAPVSDDVPDAQPAEEETTLTAGEAARYLNSGGVDLRINRRQVSRMVNRGELPALERGDQSWRRIPLSALKSKRDDLIAAYRRAQESAVPGAGAVQRARGPRAARDHSG